MASLALVASVEAASAGGYALIGQSAAAAGVAYAGVSALAEGAETAWYNPAGLAFLAGPAVSASGDLLLPRGEYTDFGSTDVLGAPRRGAAADGAAAGLVPSSYLVFPTDAGLTIGLSVNAPYGQKTDYPSDAIARYEAQLSELLALNIGLSLGFKATDWLAVGGGLDILYADTTLSNAVDFGAVCLGVVGPSCLGAGLAPQAADGTATVEGDGLAIGYNIGAIIDLDRTRIGLHYRAAIDADLDGEANFDLPAAAQFLTAGGAFTSTPATTTLRFPASVSLGVAQAVTDRVTLMGQAIWTQWSDIETVSLDFSNPAQPDETIRQDWRDSVYLSLGAAWRYSDTLVLRGGVGFDQTPVTDQYRSPRLPGADTISVALGFGWLASDSLLIDVAYQHFFYDDAPIDLSGPASGRLYGEVSNSADVVSLQATYRF